MPAKKSAPRESYLQPGRADKVSIIAWIDPKKRKALKQLALDTDRTQQDLIDEALDDLLTKHATPPMRG